MEDLVIPKNDLTVMELDRSGIKINLILPNSTFLLVGYDAGHKTPLTSYVRFDLNRIQKSDWLTTVTYSAVLRLLGRYVFPENTSNNTDYIITAAQIKCKNLYWNETAWDPSNCPLNATDISTESSTLIRGKSIPDFYEWTVTSALEKALQDNVATFRVTGYPLTASNFNGGISFWSKETADYLGNFYAGPTDILVVTTTTATSLPVNIIFAAAAIVTIVAPFISTNKGQNK